MIVSNILTQIWFKKVDIIFIDFHIKKKINDIIEIILKKKILKMNGILIITDTKKTR